MVTAFLYQMTTTRSAAIVKTAHSPTWSAQAKIQIQRNSENQTLIFLCLLLLISSKRHTKKKQHICIYVRIQQRHSIEKQHIRKKGKPERIKGIGCRQRYNSIIIAFRVRILHDLCLNNTHGNRNHIAKCNDNSPK